MKSLLRILLSVALAVLPLQAWAASGATTVSVFDSNGTARTVNVYSSTGAITGNLSWMNTICDFTTLTQCATVNSSNQLSTVEANSSSILTAVQSAIPFGANYIGQNGLWAPLSSMVSGFNSSPMTGTSSTQVVAAVVSKSIYVLHIDCVNTSSTPTLVDIEDGSGGTVLAKLAAGATYSGQSSSDSFPRFQTSSGNGLYAQNETTAASVTCNASGFSQ